MPEPVTCYQRREHGRKDKDGKELKLDYETLHLNEDGTGMFFLNGDAYELNWTCDNGVLEFTDSEGDSFKGSYTSGMIYGTYFDDITYMFTNNYEMASSIWNNQETLEEAAKELSNKIMPIGAKLYQSAADDKKSDDKDDKDKKSDKSDDAVEGEVVDK